MSTGRLAARCPACRGTSLFIAEGGYVTCARIGCPDPEAAQAVLDNAVPETARVPDASKPAA